eukprot:scaffold35451_cov21-Tisochrysis_lutea.AAC.1
MSAGSATACRGRQQLCTVQLLGSRGANSSQVWLNLCYDQGSLESAHKESCLRMGKSRHQGKQCGTLVHSNRPSNAGAHVPPVPIPLPWLTWQIVGQRHQVGQFSALVHGNKPSDVNTCVCNPIRHSKIKWQHPSLGEDR